MMRKENLHGAYLAYTEGDAHENPKPEKRRVKDGQGRKRRSGEDTAVRGGIKPRGGNIG